MASCAGITGCANAAPADENPTSQRFLLSALEEGEEIGVSGWAMKDLKVDLSSEKPKLGRSALTLRGIADAAGAKGDFSLPGTPPPNCQSLEMWVYADADSNVATVGLQVQDDEGEFLLLQMPVNWIGWKKVSFDLKSAKLTQTWPQADKNGKIDGNLRNVNIDWFAKAAGPTHITVDALTGTASPSGEESGLPFTVNWSGSKVGEPGQAMNGLLTLTNITSTSLSPTVSYSVQRDPALHFQNAPDPLYGSDHALGAKSWTEENGQRLEEGSLTDGKDWTSASATWGQHKETIQTVDLGQNRRITRLVLGPSDGNWIWKIDVSASADGKTFAPVPGLQNLDFHKNWGALVLPVQAPFQARFLRLRHHNGGEVVNSIAMPSSLSVYDGVEDEKWELPQVGEVLGSGTLTPAVEGHNFQSLPLNSEKALSPGAYLVAVKVKQGDTNQLLYSHFFVKPQALTAISSDSRFGLNTSNYELASQHRRLGIGWVRFENFKWPMISPEPGLFKFDGSVAPWNVPHDRIVEGYRKEGINVLPFLFETPEYASSAPETINKGRWAAYPPKDNAQYGEFAFQAAARYGAKKFPDQALKTPDKKSGLNQLHVYEMWNEPNLTDPGWGPWVGTTAQYLEMFRAGAEGVKRADPTGQVTNGGAAGIDLDVLEPYRTYRYADGKKPLDFVDILNVHYYSGRMAPETATVDGNKDRSGTAEGTRTFEDDLRRLMDWRDRNKPKMPIWMTETGYDSAGPFGTNEYTQAARLPRVIMMMLGAGIDKVFVYRESGSTASMHAASGLLRNDGSYKPSWFTYATLIRQLDKTSDGKRLPYPDPNVRLYQWKRGAETVVAAWTVEGESKLGLKLGQSHVVDAFGSEKDVAINGDFKLSIFPTYISKIANLSPLQQLAKAADDAEAKRRAENVRLAKTKAYLFDFGSEDKVGTLDLGEPRPFTPVLAKSVYSVEKGYGFVEAAMSDEDASWIGDPLERDAVRVGPGTQFQIQAEPGRYILKLSASPLSPDAAHAVVSNGVDGEKTFPVTQEKTHGEVTVDVKDKPLRVSIDSYAMLRWISLIKQ